MKEKIITIYKEYKNEFLKYYSKFKEKLKLFYNSSIIYFNNLKNNLKIREKRKKYLIFSGLGAIVAILIINLFTSLAFYRSINSIPFIHALVGNIYAKNYDYVLLVYLENASDNGEYHLVSDIPTVGYTYNGYKCENNSKLNFDTTLNNTNVTLNGKDICSIYFDLKNKFDITVDIMIEDEINSDTYSLTNNIPLFGYVYSHYECDNNNELNYDSTLHKITLKTNNKDNCRAYFTKQVADITIRLFTEYTQGEQDYIERLAIPSNIEYHLNSERSSCKNINNERIDTNITYTDGYIETTASEVASCEIYLDRNA